MDNFNIDEFLQNFDHMQNEPQIEIIPTFDVEEFFKDLPQLQNEQTSQVVDSLGFNYKNTDTTGDIDNLLNSSQNQNNPPQSIELQRSHGSTINLSLEDFVENAHLMGNVASTNTSLASRMHVEPEEEVGNADKRWMVTCSFCNTSFKERTSREAERQLIIHKRHHHRGKTIHENVCC